MNQNTMQRDRNPFQRNNHQSKRGPGGYQNYKQWKTGTPEAPKEKVLTSTDFPALPGAAKPKATNNTDDVSLADRVKDVMLKEEEARARGRSLQEKPEEKFDVIPLSKWMRDRRLAKQQAEERKKQELEEEEANYRWQMSPQMFPPKPEEEMPEMEDVESEEEVEQSHEYDERS
jgi:hypothetical protein